MSTPMTVKEEIDFATDILRNQIQDSPLLLKQRMKLTTKRTSVATLGFQTSVSLSGINSVLSFRK